MTADHARRLLTAVGPITHLRVVELACGDGELSQALADAVGAGGRVLAGDIADEAVRRARARLIRHANVTVARFDAHQIPCADGSVDVVIAGMLLMLTDRPRSVLEDVRRVLRSGGRVGASVWGMAQDNPWLSLIGAALTRSELAVRAAPAARPGGPFALARPDTLRRLVSSAGFEDVHIERVDSVLSCADHHAYLEYTRARLPSVAAALDRADERRRARLLEVLESATRRFRSDGELRLPVSALVCTGSVR
ncbi:methyltransferase domain-containing protein [Mycobacterium sp. CPCC 205372]|uniref:Methyltransferase domain-containing protein n=1 Tax=Mycobacterium hippophais TaxID=3016340 RepID=A0ABT4PZZ2_9MYCO|nr:class I SAM-dependent methyltransferase [Mycobacterium hippophais]MCZ8382107.1 methyltransferase domain-containing protein [Mycobacterium hippophais]